MTINVISADGKPWSIRKENLGEALKRGATLANAGEKIQVMSADGKPWEIKTANLGQALERGATLADASWGDRAKEFGQGLAGGLAGSYGALADFANKVVGAPVAHLTGVAADAVGAKDFAQKAYNLGGQYQNSNLADKFANAAAGIEPLQTNNIADTTSEVTKMAGDGASLLVPFAAAGKLVKGANTAINTVELVTKTGRKVAAPWLKKLNNFLHVPAGNAKEIAGSAASFAGMGAGAELAKSDDPNVSEGENALRELAGGVLGGLAPTAGAKGVKSVWGVIEGAAKTIANPAKSSFEAIAKLGDTTLNLEAINAAKKADIPLTANLIYKNNTAVENLQKALPSEIYKAAEKHAEKGVIESIERNLTESLGKLPTGTNQESAIRGLSQEAESQIAKLYEANQQKAEELYNQAFSALGENEMFSTTNAVEEAQKIFKKVYAPTTKGTTETGQGVVSNAMRELIGSWQGKQVPAEEMIAQLRALKEHARTAGGGYSKLFKSVENAIEKDIAASGNTEFLAKYKEASGYYRDNIAPFVQLDAARAMLDANAPNFAYQMMNNATHRKAVHEALKKLPQGEELFNSLKRVKTQEVLMEKITNNGSFDSNKFVEFFTKVKPEEEISDLVGKETYDKIKSDVFVLAEKLQTLQQSKAPVIVNQGILEKSVSAVAGVLGKNQLANAFARAAQDPKVVDRLIQAANKNNDKQFLSILDRAAAVYNNPATKASIANYGFSEALPTATGAISEGLFGSSFTNEVKKKYENGKKEKEKMLKR